MPAEQSGPRVLIVGATSAIAQEVARVYAGRGARVLLAGRSLDRLTAIASDLRVRGATSVEIEVLDVLNQDLHPELVDRAFAGGTVDLALLAHGVLPDQKLCEQDPAAAMSALEVNFVATVGLLTLLANRFETQRSGTIAVIGSVAGDRGRQSNYVYGSAKGGLALFLQGLRNRLHHAGVTVVTLKPGFVDTPMTEGVPKNFLFSTARAAGVSIHRSIESGRDVAYIPWFWRPIMMLIRALPEPVFKRLKL